MARRTAKIELNGNDPFSASIRAASHTNSTMATRRGRQGNRPSHTGGRRGAETNAYLRAEPAVRIHLPPGESPRTFGSPAAGINLGNHAVFLLEDGGKFGSEGIYVQVIGHTNAGSCSFINISWPNTALRAVDLILSTCFFFESI
jgi:hypothetical protein